MYLLGDYSTSPRAPVILMVTHHVEEIPAGFTHALVLKNGRVHAAGLIGTTLSSDVLSSAFGIPITVSRSAGRFAARGD
jgi:iron complex transport system ATP-binding protein